MGVSVTSSLWHRDGKTVALVDTSFLSCTTKKKSLFSQCIPTGTLRKRFFLLVWQTRRACLSVSLWKNKILSWVLVLFFFFKAACYLACVNGCLSSENDHQSTRPCASYTSWSWLAGGSAPAWLEEEALHVSAQLWLNIFRSQAGQLHRLQLESRLTIQIYLWAGGIDSTQISDFFCQCERWAVCVCVCVWCDLYGVSVNPLIEEWDSSACVTMNSEYLLLNLLLLLQLIIVITTILFLGYL